MCGKRKASFELGSFQADAKLLRIIFFLKRKKESSKKHMDEWIDGWR